MLRSQTFVETVNIFVGPLVHVHTCCVQMQVSICVFYLVRGNSTVLCMVLCMFIYVAMSA
jgi:hypothetical protein